MSLWWEDLTDCELLKVPLKELGLSYEDSWLFPLVNRVYLELSQKNILFRPHVWVSDEWFCADGIPGIAVPFFLLHPRLMELERQRVGECEGDNKDWALKLIRHEVGHAIDNAFRLRRLKGRKEIFGDHLIDYPDSYEFRPYSQKFVRHLKPFYAQAHPEEDWAETFAVWLGPTSQWRRKYRRSEALKKLRFMDKTMKELAFKRPYLSNSRRLDPIDKDDRTLGQYLDQKSSRHKKNSLFENIEGSRLFEQAKKGPFAHKYLIRYQKEITREVAIVSSQYQYRVKGVVGTLTGQLKGSSLRLRGGRADLVKFLSEKSLQYIREEQHKVIM